MLPRMPVAAHVAILLCRAQGAATPQLLYCIIRAEGGTYTVQGATLVTARSPLWPSSAPCPLPAASQLLRLLIAAGADVNVKPDDGITPLMKAERGGHAAVAQLLRDHGAVE
jgi:hypothetical protein